MSDQDKLREIKEALKAGSKDAKDALVEALDVLDGEEPAPIPEPEPLPDPVPEPQPDPVPEPQPEPLPDPIPAPDPIPEPQPDPVPEPQPEPLPDPVPVPDPIPEPQPDPVPVPAPAPAILVQELPAPEAVEVFALSISLPANFLDILKDIIAKMGGSIA